MNRKDFWIRVHSLPVQDDFLDLEEINPADAYRKQAEAINAAGPLYAELESLENRFDRVNLTLKEIRGKLLSQNMPLSSTATRTSELVDAFVLSAAENYRDEQGEIKNVQNSLLRMERLRGKLETRIAQVTRRLRAIEAMADKCDRIMNWAKHEARLETKK